MKLELECHEVVWLNSMLMDYQKQLEHQKDVPSMYAKRIAKSIHTKMLNAKE